MDGNVMSWDETTDNKGFNMLGYFIQQKGWRIASILFFLMIGAIGTMGCGKSVPSSREEERMLALLSIAKSHHRLASLALQTQRSAQAIREMDEILKLQFPQNFRPGEEMLLDAWARKAEIQLKLQQIPQALHTIETAIARPSWLKHSYYLAHLHQVKGQILEAMKRPHDAVKAYQQSIQMNQAVIQNIQQPSKK